MQKILKNKQGFTALEVILIVVVTAFLAGGIVYGLDRQRTNSPTSASTSTSAEPKSTAKTPTKSDDELITESLTDHCRNSSGDRGVVGEFNPSTKDQEGAFYRVGARCITPGTDTVGGFSAIFKKENGKMTFLLGGQQLPGKEDGTKYGLPSSWYSTDY